ncbi:MAG TPA: cbb3-type cytochrome c oxidase subunit I, partial [Tepidiformaceae bacterium]|nr:cbb3-type cytochrome c oxidase subunit I [Tepidiformaceae bacterium]
LFLVMGLLGLALRLSHAQLLQLSPVLYDEFFTLHGSGMVAAILLGAMGGVVAVLGPPVALDVRVLWIAFVVYVLGLGYIPLSVLLGGFAAGWTMLYPLPVIAKGMWTGWATSGFLLGFLFVAVGFGVFCVAVITGTSRAYGGVARALAWPLLFSKGRRAMTVVPRLEDITATVISIYGLFTVLAGTVYLVPLLGQTAGFSGPVNALVMKNLVFLFGHNIVNLTIYLGAALVYATLPTYAGRPWRTSWVNAFGINILLISILLPYLHHLYQDFANAVPLQILGELGSYDSGMSGLFVTVIGGFMLVYRAGLRWAVPSILILLGFWGWVFGGFGAVLDGTIPVNQVYHNTLWVPAHFHTYYLLGAAAFVWAFLYHLVLDLSGRSEPLASRVAAWLYGVGGAGFVLMFFVAGAAGMPRRYAVPVPGTGEEMWATIASVFVIVLGLALAWLTFDVFSGLKPAWERTKALPAVAAAPPRRSPPAGM